MAPYIRAIATALLLLPLLISIRSKAEEYHLPAEVVELADQYATDDISSSLIQAVIWTESRGVPDAVSADGYNIGLMQLHVWYFTGDLTDQENNVRQGAEYLQSLYDRFGDLSVALMAYHGESDLTKEPSYYARSIQDLAQEIRRKRQGEALKQYNAKMKKAWRLYK